MGHSKSWVKKWIRRICSAPLEDREILNGQSRARKRPPPRFPSELEEKILEIRDHPPGQLKRTPGPLTILYYLNQDQSLKDTREKLPRSTSTVWKILDCHHRIYHPLLLFLKYESLKYDIISTSRKRKTGLMLNDLSRAP